MTFYISSSCIAALLGARVILTDLPDRLRLLKKNVETNLYGDVRGSATVNELIWGDDLDKDFTDPLPDIGEYTISLLSNRDQTLMLESFYLCIILDGNLFGSNALICRPANYSFWKNTVTVLGSDVVYSEGAVTDLMETLIELCGKQTTVILAGELRNGIELF